MTNEDGGVTGKARLTPKERECLSLVLENRSSKEIARQLGISHTSVDTHIRRARAKLQLRDRYAAAQAARAGETGRGRAAVVDRPRLAGSQVGPGWSHAGAIRSMIPPMETLGPWSRLFLVLALASFMALLFGVILNALSTL